MRPNNIQDTAAPSHKIQIRKQENEIPVWGTKRARSALLLGGDDLLLRSSQIPPIWGAKRARSALIRGSNWRDWTNLGDGPAGLIAERLLASDVADYVSFRAVCRPWRLCCTDPHAHGILDRRFHPRQWIMLRATGVSPLRRSFLNVSTGYSRYVDLPELRDHCVFGPTSEGLLVLVDMATYVVRLLNPFTRQAAKFPPATTLMNQRDLGRIHLRMVLLSVSGAGLADDNTFAVHFHMMRTLAVVKPGDVHWTVVDRGKLLFPAMSFAGRFYCCATDHAVMVVETSADRPPRLALAAELIRPFGRIMMDTVHLVDNDGELMLVDRECPINSGIKYNVHRVDLDARKMLPVRGLGGRAVFIGTELSLSVSPLVFPSISADTIYLGFEGCMTSNSPIDLMDGTSYPRQRERSVCGPSGLDYYLSWYVTGYGDTLRMRSVI
ncbi:unnamed protein product [Miscanthus lutarioriparius]|uniref:KIB1-4 beta-propeller domain-containing protein n=1 Tax=Miscanthus lutarioriparius TaxID=422564 RepID=A0A811MNP4_9POAL|nr:unnamed protein product [Miscanthus lutarioriparius]